MTPDQETLQAFASTTRILLEEGEADKAVNDFLESTATFFGADAALVYQADADPVLGTYQLDSRAAAELATGIRSALGSGMPATRRWAKPDGTAEHLGWPAVLAARFDRGCEPAGALALLGSTAEHFEAPRDESLLELFAGQLRLALVDSSERLRIRREAERISVQVEATERVHRALERHSRRIERSLAERSRFLAAVSHELRTPINAIMGYAQLLQEGIYGPLAPGQETAAGKILSCTRQLLALVDDVLDISKIDAGRLDVVYDHVDLLAMINEAYASIETAAGAKGIHFEIDVPDMLPGLQTDGMRVRQILSNLLSNAVKFTERGRVTLQVTHQRPQGARSDPGCRPGSDGWIAITVQDTGIGIPPDQLDRIFGEFAQVQQGKGAPREGSGLGLAISSRLARLVGGRLTVHSEVGVSSAFTLFLPCPCPLTEPVPAEI